MFSKKGNSFYTNEGFLCGLKQLDPRGGWLSHHPTTGWEIETPNIDEHQHIYLQDDLTYVDNKIVEFEKYIKHYGEDIKKITFYTWHKKISNIYPKLTIKWHPLFLKQHLNDAVKHQALLKNTFNFDKKTKKFLCLNARLRRHRDLVVDKIKDNKNCIFSYTHKGIKSPLQDDWTVEEYRDYNIKNENYLTNTKNLLVISPLYNQTSFSLVIETRYQLPYDFVTEKTTQCWLALHPALYVSNRYHVAQIRDWGFDLFDDIFDHSYDSASDSDRIDVLFKNNVSQLNNGIVITDDVKQRLLKNREHYLDNFHNILSNTK